MKTAIQFGAGNIGRGFLGQLFTESGYQVVFVDVNRDLVSRLNARGSYPLQLVGRTGNSRVIVQGVRALHVDDRDAVAEAIASADIMATAVGKGALGAVALLMALGLELRFKRKVEKPLNVIICENLFQGARILREAIRQNLAGKYDDELKTRLGLVESVVSRMVPGVSGVGGDTDPLLIVAEEYAVLPVDKNGFVGEVPGITGMQLCDPLIARQEQKMFTHNTGHSLCAYLGYLKGYRTIHEAIRDGGIKKIIVAALDESGRALVKKHKLDAQDHQAYVADLMERFGRAALNDTVFRGAKDPLRKLGRDDRMIGAARLALDCGVKPDFLATGIAAAIHYDEPRDPDAVRLARMKSESVDKVLRDVCGLDPAEALSLSIKASLPRIDAIKNSAKE